MKESEIQSEIIDYLMILEKQGKLFFQRVNNTAIYDPVGKKFRSMGKGAKRGFPDILVIKRGRVIGLEVKRPGAKQKGEQEVIEEMLKKNGAEYYVVRSVEDVRAIFKL